MKQTLFCLTVNTTDPLLSYNGWNRPSSVLQWMKQTLFCPTVDETDHLLSYNEWSRHYSVLQWMKQTIFCPTMEETDHLLSYNGWNRPSSVLQWMKQTIFCPTWLCYSSSTSSASPSFSVQVLNTRKGPKKENRDTATKTDALSVYERP